MNQQSLVSIIIPAYNAGRTIEGTLNSLLCQNYENIEIIVVDDGSTDDTAEIVKGYGGNVRYLYQANSGGCAKTRNVGLAHCAGEFIGFIDADDLMLCDRIEKQVSFFNRHPAVDIVFCDYRNFHESEFSTETHFQSCPIIRQMIKDRDELILNNACSILARENFGIMGTVLMRRRCLTTVGVFHPDLKACEDFHFYYRCARRSPVGLMSNVGMLRRLHANNMTNNVWKMLHEGIRSRSFLCQSEEDPTAYRYLLAYIAQCMNSLSRLYADDGRYHLSFKHSYTVMGGPYAFTSKIHACKNIFRTVSMVLGLYRIGEKCGVFKNRAPQKRIEIY